MKANTKYSLSMAAVILGAGLMTGPIIRKADKYGAYDVITSVPRVQKIIKTEKEICEISRNLSYKVAHYSLRELASPSLVSSSNSMSFLTEKAKELVSKKECLERKLIVLRDNPEVKALESFPLEVHTKDPDLFMLGFGLFAIGALGSFSGFKDNSVN